MSNQLETNLEIILNEKITKILPENIKSGVTILGVNGSFEGGTQLPEDIFIQSDVPTKTTNEAIWLKQSPADDTPFLDKLPDEILNIIAYDNTTIGDAFNSLSSENREIINSAERHIILMYSDALKLYVGNISANIKLEGTNRTEFMYIEGGCTTFSFSNSGTYVDVYTSTVSTTSGLAIHKYIDFPAYYNGEVYIAPNIEFVNRTEPGLNIVNGNIMTTVYMNKGTEFEKILDTSNADATAGDIVEGKTAFVNNTKITGTLIVPMSQEEYNTALSTANNILGDTNDTWVNLNSVPNGELKEYLRIPKSFSISEAGMNKLSNLGTESLHCTNMDIDGGAGYFLINHIGLDNMYFDLCLEMSYFAQWNYNSSTGMFELDAERNGGEIATIEGDYVYLSNPNGTMVKNGDIDTDIWGMIFIDTSK